MASDDSTPPPPASDDEQTAPVPRTQEPDGQPDPDAGATSPGWTPVTAPGKPDGEVDTRAP